MGVPPGLRASRFKVASLLVGYASVPQERSWRGLGFDFAAYGHRQLVLPAEQIGAQHLARLFEQGALGSMRRPHAD